MSLKVGNCHIKKQGHILTLSVVQASNEVNGKWSEYLILVQGAVDCTQSGGRDFLYVNVNFNTSMMLQLKCLQYTLIELFHYV